MIANRFDLEKRLIDYSVLIISIVNEIPNSKPGNHLGSQLIRSGTSTALNYGEAQSGESRKDFIHKIKIVLKELRESYICLKIIKQAGLTDSYLKLEQAIRESDELVSIFVKSVSTAQKNLKSN